MSRKSDLVNLWASIERISVPAPGHGHLIQGYCFGHAQRAEARRQIVRTRLRLKDDPKRAPLAVVSTLRYMSRREARVPARKAEP